MGQRRAQGRCVACLQHAHQHGLAVRDALDAAADEEVRKHRRDCHRHHETGQDGRDVRDAQWHEQAPLDAGQREQGDIVADSAGDIEIQTDMGVQIQGMGAIGSVF